MSPKHPSEEINERLFENVHQATMRNEESPRSHSPTTRDISPSNISEMSTNTTNTVNMETNEFDNDSYEVISQDDRAMETSENNDVMMTSSPTEQPIKPISIGNKQLGSGFSSDDYQVLSQGSFEFMIPDWNNCLSICQTLEGSTTPTPASLGTADFEKNLKSSGRIVSESIIIDDQRWRLIVCPVGNQGVPREEVAVFVELQNELVGDTAVCAQMIIGVKNGEKTIQKPADHRFDNFERDWGFNQFTTHRQLDRDALIAQDGSLTFFLSLRIVKDELGTLWHNFVNYNSKRATGFVGLQNQGATCYMNSLLQSLFLTNSFRRMVYSIPTAMVDPNDNIPHALQRVFYRLQTRDSPVGTTELTRSFGWDTLDAFMQHDVQEFSRVLLDDLEEKMKKTLVEGALEKLFVGKMQNVIKCLNVDYQSVREESFYDLQMAVKGMQTLEDSFRAYIKPEMLDGNNKYHAEQYGLQDAKRFVAFERFPPVLHCHLVRYTFDPETGDIAKFNGRLAFPTRLSLGQFLSEDVSEEERLSNKHDYLLHSVLVHSGDSHGGHYFVFVKDFKCNKWFKFDDTRVIPVTEKEAVDDNFGGDVGEERSMQQLPRRPGPALLRRFTNAYMLVYIRESELDTIMADVTEADIPSHIPERIKFDDEAEERRRLEKHAQLQACPVYVIDDKMISTHHGFDLYNTDVEQGQPLTIPVRLDMRRDDTVGRLRAMIGKHFELYGGDASIETIDKESKRVNIWTMAGRKNRTTRVDQYITSDDRLLGQFTTRMLNNGGGSSPPPLVFYASLDHAPVQGNFLIWFKLITPTQQEDPLMPSGLSMLPLRPIFVSPKGCILDHFEELSKHVQGPLNDYQFYEELKPGRVDLLDPSKTFAALELRGGDIIAFGGKEVKVTEYYDDLTSRVGVDLVKRGGGIEKIQLAFNLKMNGKQAYEVAAQALNCSPDNLRLLLAERGTDYPTSTSIKHDMKLADQLTRNINRPTHVILYYEILTGVSASEIDGLHALNVTIDGVAKQIYIAMPTTIKDVFEKVQADKEEHILQEVYNHKISSFFSYSDAKFSAKPMAEYCFVKRPNNVDSIPDTTTETSNLKNHPICIPLFHYYRECSIAHSTPMFIPLIPGETFALLQQRVIKIVMRSDERPEDIQVNFVFYGRVMPLSGEEVLVDRADVQTQWNDCSTTGVMVHIGVNHTPPPSQNIMSPKATSHGERTGIRIKK